MEPNELIVCRDASLGYEGQSVLAHLDLTIRAGDYLCIVGDNGSGKSTLLRCINLLERPNQGESASTAGPSPAGDDASAYRTRVGMGLSVFQPLFQYERAGELHGGTGKGAPPEP